MPTTRKKPARKRASKKKTSGRVTAPPKLPTTWPAAETSPRLVSELQPYARNAKKHTKAQISAVARSIEEWGWTMPILVDEKGGVIAGHCRLEAAKQLELEAVPVMVARGWSEAQRRAYVIADNKLTESAWDTEVLGLELGEIGGLGFDLDLTGFTEKERQPLLFPEAHDNGALTEADARDLPELEAKVVTKPGNVWILGDHRLMCGDSTRADDVRRLFGDVSETGATGLIVADPPYGMGKEKEGVANDNNYGAELDRFQLSWWKVWRDQLAENGSVYVWGNAPDLWRLWYTGGLSRDDLMVRNEIVWDKGAGFGMRSEGQHSFSVGTERCLFLMRGQQFLGNQNKDDYWEGWEPLRTWLVEQRELAGWNVKKVNALTGTHMAGHWFGRSQFQPISAEHYATLQEAANGVAFVEDYDELFERLFPGLRDAGNAHRRELSARVRESRTYFDNAHDAMTDVWQFGRVHGEERFGHATPKPVAMIGRCVKSSSPEGGLVADPFSGTGTVLAACQLLGRKCYAMELAPQYVDVAVRRWQELAGEPARLEGSGETFDALVAK